MASKTSITEKVRKQKRAGKGKERKRVLRSKGSTPTKSKLFGDKE